MSFKKNGIGFCHSPAVRRAIEQTGFVYRPMMFKRDRTECDICGIEVSGWRSWDDPKTMHDIKKHKEVAAKQDAERKKQETQK